LSLKLAVSINQQCYFISTISTQKHGVADRAHARSISACNVLLTVHSHYKSPVADRVHARYADSHEMATLIATKLLMLRNQPPNHNTNPNWHSNANKSN